MTGPDCVELNFRDSPEGGVIDPNRAWAGATALRGKKHLIFLVHGYNDTQDEARDAYSKFKEKQDSIANPAGSDWAFGATLVEVYWPGDGKWGLLRPLFYPLALPVADETAKVLAGILHDTAMHSDGGLTLDFVCHSVGNRLVLQLLSLIASDSAITVRRVLHMAGAVATWRIEKPGDSLRNGLLREVRGEKVTSLFSSQDDVLAFAFPLGETLQSGEEGVLPVALGHQQWVNGAGLVNQISEKLGHSDYWDKLDPGVPHDALALVTNAPRAQGSASIAGAAEVEPRTLGGYVIGGRSIGESVA